MTWDRKSILWALPQPLLVAGSVLLVAAMVVNEWGGNITESGHYSSPFLLRLLLIAERFWAKKQSWLLKPDEMAEDVFWMASGGLLWGPLFPTCIAHPFLRDSSPSAMSPLQIEFQPSTVLGLIGAMLVIRFTSSFTTMATPHSA